MVLYHFKVLLYAQNMPFTIDIFILFLNMYLPKLLIFLIFYALVIQIKLIDKTYKLL